MPQDSRIVGKHTLESLTVGMYADSRIIFREYVQNATDAIDRAVLEGTIAQDEGQIDITIDPERREIRIRDNGTGIRTDDVFHALGDIGHSNKAHDEDRGFRGIGRLGGLGYCTELHFITSCQGESCQTITSWYARRLRELLQPNNDEFDGVIEVVNAVTTQETQPELSDAHYFEVVLSGIITGHESLLDIDNIRDYLSQVAPVPFNYTHGSILQVINDKFREYNLTPEEYRIFLHDYEDHSEQIYKPYRRAVPVDRKNNEFITGISFFEGKSDGDLFFLGWYGETELSGIVKDDAVNGLRVRKRNILIGSNRSLDEFFGSRTNQRFNRWFIGEIYVFDDDLIPNARRDDFEKNMTYFAFKREVEKTTHQLARLPHRYSNKRSTEKKLSEIPQNYKRIKEEVSSPVGITETRKEQLSEQVKGLKKKAKQINPDAFAKVTPPTTLIATEGNSSEHEFESSQPSILPTDRNRSTLIEKKEQIIEHLEELDATLTSSNHFPIQHLPSSISRPCRKHIDTIFNVIDKVLDEGLAQELREEIFKALQPRPKKEKRS